MAAALTKAFAARDAKKTYFAIVTHWPEDQDAGVIDAPLVKARVGGEERVMVDFDHPEAQSAQTFFRVERRSPSGRVLMALEPRTGRTHQLRVHVLHVGGAILGDGKYGVRLPSDWGAPKRLYLHAASLEIDHPKGGQLELHAPLPSAFEEALNA
jgi:23S rRNA pseudouridine955/2504/2580 synthase